MVKRNCADAHIKMYQPDFIETDEDLFDDLMDEVKHLLNEQINDELAANGVVVKKEKDKKSENLTMKEKTASIISILKDDNLASYLPPRVLHTEIFREAVLDKVSTVLVPTNIYRITIRKLLKLPFRELQEQATLLEINVTDKDEIELAKEILANLKEDSPLNDLLKRRLLKTEMAVIVGVDIQVVRKDKVAGGNIHLSPQDLMTSGSLLTMKDVENECKNQGIKTSRNDSFLKLSVRLISHFQISANRVRIPLTQPFEEFLLAKLESY